MLKLLRRKGKGGLDNRHPPPVEKLMGDLKGADSRRINIQHRLVYQVLEEEKVVKVLPLWTHYEWPALLEQERSPPPEDARARAALGSK